MKKVADILNNVARTTNFFYDLSEDEVVALRKCLLSIYSDVENVCKKYNLCIMLGGGSALGAVRHQGFIPWDDDLDIIMPRKDYNKLIEVFDKELGEKYVLSVPQIKQESMYLFMIIVKKNTLMYFEKSDIKNLDGIRIDIFPIENAPTNTMVRICVTFIADIFRFIVISVKYYKHRRKRPLLKKAFSQSLNTGLYYYFRQIIGMIFSVFPQKYLYDLYDKFVSCSSGNKYCTIPTGRQQYRGETQVKDVFFPVKKTLFEEIEVNIPNNVDIYLKSLYGENYMQIPPENKRERHFYLKFSLDTTKNDMAKTINSK
jgi:lipopolysaccharide cholinephosphotransferase